MTFFIQNIFIKLMKIFYHQFMELYYLVILQCQPIVVTNLKMTSLGFETDLKEHYFVAEIYGYLFFILYLQIIIFAEGQFMIDLYVFNFESLFKNKIKKFQLDFVIFDSWKIPFISVGQLCSPQFMFFTFIIESFSQTQLDSQSTQRRIRIEADALIRAQFILHNSVYVMEEQSDNVRHDMSLQQYVQKQRKIQSDNINGFVFSSLKKFPVNLGLFSLYWVAAIRQEQSTFNQVQKGRDQFKNQVMVLQIIESFSDNFDKTQAEQCQISITIGIFSFAFGISIIFYQILPNFDLAILMRQNIISKDKQLNRSLIFLNPNIHANDKIQIGIWLEFQFHYLKEEVR
ncbi:hypothetical protein pb186bvf_012751 [Paramecium bursaria]